MPSAVRIVEFLQGLISNDTTKAAAGRAIWAALLTPQGRFLNDMFVVDGGDGTLLLETERERAAGARQGLSMYKLRSKVTVEDRGEELEVAVAYGADARRALPIEGTWPSWIRGWPARRPRDRTGGHCGGAAAIARLLGRAVACAMTRFASSLACPTAAATWPVEKALLLESGFDELNGVDWQKGCYIGQELTARTKYRGPGAQAPVPGGGSKVPCPRLGRPSISMARKWAKSAPGSGQPRHRHAASSTPRAADSALSAGETRLVAGNSRLDAAARDDRLKPGTPSRPGPPGLRSRPSSVARRAGP